MTPPPPVGPLLTTYRAIKASLPAGTLLIYRLGDFGELFEEDAEIAAKALRLTLTRRRSATFPDGFPMAGVPWHALDTYARQLQAAGHSVALVEEMPHAKPGAVPRVVQWSA